MGQFVSDILGEIVGYFIFELVWAGINALIRRCGCLFLTIMLLAGGFVCMVIYLLSKTG